MRNIIVRAASVAALLVPLSTSALLTRTSGSAFTVSTTTFTTEAKLAAPTVETQETAGITADSSLYFFDKLYDDVRIALTLDPVEKTQTILEVSEERAAETLVSASSGDLEAAAESTGELADLMVALDTTVQKIDDPALLEATMTDIEAALTENKTLLEQAVATTTEESGQTLTAAVNELNAKIVEAVETAVETAETVAPTAVAGCDQQKYDACLRTTGCTTATSATCFLKCPPLTVTCENPAPGKTCMKPDDACREACLRAIATCNEDCLQAAGCKEGEVTPTEKLIDAETIEKTFNIQLDIRPQ